MSEEGLQIVEERREAKGKQEREIYTQLNAELQRTARRDTQNTDTEVAQSCLTLCDPMDCSPSGSSVHGIFQARVLEWGAIAFSGLHVLTTYK